jgi:hypothetical protein
LRVVAAQRDEIKAKYQAARKAGTVWFHNYHCCRHELVAVRLRLRGAEQMIEALLTERKKDGKSDFPDIELSSD